MAIVQTVIDDLPFYIIHPDPLTNNGTVKAGPGDIADKKGPEQTVTLRRKYQLAMGAR